jgi:hypothetical protein
VRKVVGYKSDIQWDSSKPDGTPRKLLDISRMKALGVASRSARSRGPERLSGFPRPFRAGKCLARVTPYHFKLQQASTPLQVVNGEP